MTDGVGGLVWPVVIGLLWIVILAFLVYGGVP